MINDDFLMKATTSLSLRSEKADPHKLINTFVDSGILAQLVNSNDQILYGRRGTGKTHVFQVVAHEFEKTNTNCVVSIDGRTLGSSPQFIDYTIPLQKRCTSLFRDVLNEINNGILEHIVNFPPSNSEEALASWNRLSSITMEPIAIIKNEVVSEKNKLSQQKEASLDSSVSVPLALNLSGKVGQTSSVQAEKEISYAIDREDKVVFPTFQALLSEVIIKSELNLVVLFDEWSSIPTDIQPFLAEFIKRSILPNKKCTIKIASLEYRSRFELEKDHRKIGFELGSDIFANIDLDDYYVFDRRPDAITDLMGDILFKHIESELPTNYLEKKYGINSRERFVTDIFTQRKTFQELVRASEGVIRDLINIFVKAYFYSQRNGRDKIDLKSIEQASREWFETDKEQTLNESLRKVVARIVEEVIGEHHARSFLVERDLERHSVIQQLLDARIIHLVKRGYADKDSPGTRYSIFTLDYGTYVGLKNTSAQPELDFKSDQNDTEKDRVVPFDDKRSIRRIVLKQEILSP